jgi:enoyl-CoA hydratase/carnithine racemase
MTRATTVMPMTEVLYDVADHIATITLNAPERLNTISGAMLDQLSVRLLDLI